MPIGYKIAVTECYKIKETDKVMGLAPADYQIFKKLNLLNLKEGFDKKVPEDEIKREDLIEIPRDEKLAKWWDTFLKSKIISHKSYFFIIESFLVLPISIFTSYWYGFLAIYGVEDTVYSDQYWWFEIFFGFDLLLQFFVDYIDKTNGQVVRSYTKIFWNYIYGDFIRDFITILPLQLIPLPLDSGHYMFLIKCLRMFKGSKLVDSDYLMKGVKNYYHTGLAKLERDHPEIANDPTLDNTKMIHIIRF